MTRYFYEGDRLVRSESRAEPEWNARQRAAVDAWLDWRADRHTCGRQLSESLRRDGHRPPDYVVGELVCAGCEAEAKFIKEHHKDGLPPELLLQVYSRAEAQAIEKLQRGD